MQVSRSRFSLLLFAEITIGFGLVVSGLAFYLWGMNALSDSPSRQHRRLAIEALSAEDYEAATSEYRKAAELDPANAEIPYELGVAYSQAGRMTDAIAAWREALRLDPTMNVASESIRNASRSLPPTSFDGPTGIIDSFKPNESETVRSLSVESLQGAAH